MRIKDARHPIEHSPGEAVNVSTVWGIQIDRFGGMLTSIVILRADEMVLRVTSHRAMSLIRR